MVKNPPAKQEMQEICVQSLSWEISPGGEHGNPLQYSCLENPVDRGAWRAMALGSQRVNTTEATYHTHTHAHHIEGEVGRRFEGWKGC